MHSLKFHILRLLRASSSLKFRQLQSVDSLWNAYVTWREHTVICTAQVSTQNRAESFGQFGQMAESFWASLVILGSSLVAVTLTTDFTSAWIKEFLDLQATIECWFTLKRVLDMTRTYSQMHPTDMCVEQSSIIWPVCPNGWVFFYELSDSGFESSCSHLNFRFRACLDKGVPWHSGSSRVWIHSETLTWHEKNIDSNAPYREVQRTWLNHLAFLAK